MSLAIKHLNSDTSFLLTFTPSATFSSSPSSSSPEEYTIILDPWLVGPSNIFHHKFSTTRHKTAPCISSLIELPEPDLVIISQSKSDHCHKQTLTQLPASGGKTIILAEPGAAKVIRGWKYFAPEKVVTLPRWEELKEKKRKKGKKNNKIGKNMCTISIPPQSEDGTSGEVTIAHLSQKPDLTGLHNAIAITYQSPTARCQPDSPRMTPASIYSTFSTTSTASQNTRQPLSLIYSPHGLPYKYVLPYVVSHLIPLSALPLTALLHSFDSVQNAWYLGGNICSGLPGGRQIAQNLLARVWISAHDGEKDIRGIANGNLEVRKYDISEVENVVSPRSERFPNNGVMGTEAIVLGVGEEIVVDAIGGRLRFEGRIEKFKENLGHESPETLWTDGNEFSKTEVQLWHLLRQDSNDITTLTRERWDLTTL